LLLASTLLTAATFAHAQSTPAAAEFGIGTAGAASGITVPVGPGIGNVGQVPEPETWLFTLGGLLLAGLLRRRKR
jgi:MYXO-CTERM domain-containing protein